MAGELAAIAVLEPEDHVTDAPGERQCGDDPTVGPAERRPRRRAGQGESARTA
jgi:hypothetical protein